MSLGKAEEIKVVSPEAAKEEEASEKIAGKLIDFQRGTAEVMRKQERQRLLEQMQGMTTSEKQVFLLGMIMNEETLGRIWKNLLDALRTEFEN
jgi:hypothetical protein